MLKSDYLQLLSQSCPEDPPEVPHIPQYPARFTTNNEKRISNW